MKQILRSATIFLAIIFYAGSSQAAATLENINIVNKIGITTPITVSLKQEGTAVRTTPQKPVKFFKNTKKLSYVATDNDTSIVTIEATIEVDGKPIIGSERLKASDLSNRELHIGKDATGKPTIIPFVVLPKKQQVKSYKPNKNQEYIVQVVDSSSEPEQIAKATFKENTTRLYVRLNKKEDTDPVLRPYNSNTIKVLENFSDSRTLLGSFTIKAGKLPQGYGLMFYPDKAVVLDKERKETTTIYKYTK